MITRLLLVASMCLGYVSHAYASTLYAIYPDALRTEQQPNDYFFNRNLDKTSTSFSATLNSVLDRAMSNALDRYYAKSAFALIMETDTGRIRGLSFAEDTHEFKTGQLNRARQLDRLASTKFLFHSFFKFLATAAGIEMRVTSTASMIDMQPMHADAYSINDHIPINRRQVPLSDAFANSSNISAARLAEKVGATNIRRFFRSLGLFDAFYADEFLTAPLVFGRDELALVATGYNMEANPLHTAKAVSILLNGGHSLNPNIRLNAREERSPRVVHRRTAVELGGLLKKYAKMRLPDLNAEFEGKIGGFASTDEKVDEDGMSRAVVTTFLSVFPIDKPKYFILTVIDEPQVAHGDNYNSATANAVPVTSDFLREIRPILDLKQ